jgi:hypothetical protein
MGESLQSCAHGSARHTELLDGRQFRDPLAGFELPTDNQFPEFAHRRQALTGS